ncbi:MAG: hypothetical protein JJ900_10625 [Rhodospirillales bacterium]|nr:hypothetical protein [Rhodospirillales bacterium]MBO6787293.1 hypothetical protein [Rhodospirillales bacterium]
MAADFSVAAPPPVMPAHGKNVAGAIVAAVAVSVLAFCSFGLVLDLMVVVVARMAGLPESMTWAAAVFGTAGALAFAAWCGRMAWLQELTQEQDRP